MLRHGLIDRLPGGLLPSRADLAALLPPDGPSSGTAAYDPVEYLIDYFAQFAQMGVTVYWGDLRSFMAEPRQRWRAHVPA